MTRNDRLFPLWQALRVHDVAEIERQIDLVLVIEE